MSSNETDICQPLPRPGPGRPPVLSDKARHDRIISAAEEVFFVRGFAAATMEEIAKSAGMSKRTLYKHFDNKEALFIAFVTEADIAPDKLTNGHSDPLEELRQRFQILIRHVLSPRQIKMTRLMIEEADTLPAIAKAFYERVMKRGHCQIAETLKKLCVQYPDLSIIASERSAAVVTGAVLGELHIRALLGETSAITDTEILQRVDIALELVFGQLRS